MELETKRLILREWNENDAKDLIEGLNNIEVSKWLAFVPHPYTKKDAEKWILFCVENAKKGMDRTAYEFAIELKAGGKVIGGTALDKINRFQGTAGGGIWINAEYHGQGYGTEAFGRRIHFAFDKLGLRRLENGFLDGNPSSFKMQEKFGYKIEGMRRKAFRCMADGEIKDEYITGLLKDEWISQKANIPPQHTLPQNPRFPKNASGETYGSNKGVSPYERGPDLVKAVGVDGTVGYIRETEADGEQPRTPEEAIAYQAALKDREINLYESDGKTVIGKFVIGTGNRSYSRKPDL